MKEFENPDSRAIRLHHVLTQGPTWETQTDAIIDAVSIRKSKPIPTINAITNKTPKHKIANKRPGAKAVNNWETSVDGPDLTPEDETSFRALAARANYLALDRPDIAFATKELCRHFSKPTEEAVLALMRLVRYLVGTARAVRKM